MIEIIDSIDWNLWDDFVYNHPYGNIFQTSHIARVYRKTENYEYISLAAVDSETKEILSVLLVVIIRERKGLIGYFSSRAVITGGPLYVQGRRGYEATEKIMRHYEEIARKKVIYTQIRNMWDTEDIKEIVENEGYIYEEHLNYLIDLDQEPEKIWQNIQKYRRRDIKKAEKNGIKINKVESLSQIKDFYIFIQETYKRSKIPLASISLFESAFNELVPKSMVDFYIATQNDIGIGSCMMLRYKNTIYEWYIGSQNDEKYADGVLVWNVLKENAGKEKIFDFGGAGNPKKPYGVRDFKRRFGGREVNFGRYLKVHNKWRKRIADTGFNIYRRLTPFLLSHSR